MCPLYVSGLIDPGDRKSIQPMAERLALGEYDQLHHFIAAGVWDSAPVETELLVQADRLVGGSDAVLVIDDTAIAKKGAHSRTKPEMALAGDRSCDRGRHLLRSWSLRSSRGGSLGVCPPSADVGRWN